jgi:putative transposase
LQSSIDRRPSSIAHAFIPPGAYLVTLWTHNRECLLGQIAGGKMELSPTGEIARECWSRIPHRFPEARLHAQVLMPNHLHAIVIIAEREPDLANKPRSKGGRDPQGPIVGDEALQPVQEAGGRLRDLVEYFKQAVTEGVEVRETGAARSVAAGAANALPTSTTRPGVSNIPTGAAGPIWHDGYSEHIIRSQPAFDRIREYIFANPLMWSYDPANPCRSGPWLADLEDLLHHDGFLVN